MKMKIWRCKIGDVENSLLADGADEPMREAVIKAYKKLTGRTHEFCLSGWGSQLSTDERTASRLIERLKKELREQEDRAERAENEATIMAGDATVLRDISRVVTGQDSREDLLEIVIGLVCQAKLTSNAAKNSPHAIGS